MKKISNLHRMIRAALVVLSLPLVVAFSGCGDLNRTALGSSDPAVSEDVMSTRPAGYLVFSQRAAVRAAKKVQVDVSAGVFTHTESRYFESDENEKLEIEFGQYGNRETVRVDKATFWVRSNAMDISDLNPDQIVKYVKRDSDNRWSRNSSFDCRIDMAVSTGKTIEDVVVAFGPDELKFDPIAKLVISMKGPLRGKIQAGKGVAYHISKNGDISKVEMDVSIDQDGGKLVIDVPGFSRYGVDDE